MSALVFGATALPVVATYLLLQPARQAGVSRPWTVALALGVGLGLSSCTFFLALVLFDGRLGGVIGIDAVLLLIALTVWRRSAAPPAAQRVPLPAAERILAVAVLVAAAAAATSAVANTFDLPHGRWDAWATWNTRARWLAEAGPAWRSAFAKPTIHGDYPLLLPATVARLWVYAGADATVIPAAVGAAYGVALVLLLYAALATLRGRAQGLIGALCLLGTPFFLRLVSWQYADVPLAFNLLAVVTCLLFYDQDAARGRAMLVWGGVAAGLLAWTKNEGMVLVLGILLIRGVSMIVRRTPDLRAAMWFALGLLPLAAMVFYFKMLAPPSPQLTQPVGSMIQRLLDPARYGIIFRSGAYELARGTFPLVVGLITYALLLGRTRDQRGRGMAAGVAAIVAFAALAYLFTYATARAELTWVVNNSVDRLEFQLWPCVLLALFLFLASPSEHEPPLTRPVARAVRRRAQAGPRRRRQTDRS